MPGRWRTTTPWLLWRWRWLSKHLITSKQTKRNCGRERKIRCLMHISADIYPRWDLVRLHRLVVDKRQQHHYQNNAKIQPGHRGYSSNFAKRAQSTQERVNHRPRARVTWTWKSSKSRDTRVNSLKIETTEPSLAIVAPNVGNREMQPRNTRDFARKFCFGLERLTDRLTDGTHAMTTPNTCSDS